jgi:transcriptional regulator with XRE-family HTH domain
VKPDSSRRQEIRSFLMARRAALSPEAAGLQGGLRRRTPGLRREELATLAGVGVTWYTWLEQGRDISISGQTLTRIARALRLTQADTTYLFSLAGVPQTEASLHTGSIDQPMKDALLGFRTEPAMIGGLSWDVDAFNPLADWIFRFDDYTGPFARNHAWRFFMDPVRRSLYLDWQRYAESFVGVMRVQYARSFGGAYFESLIGALREGSPEFRRLWELQNTMSLDPVEIGFRLPQIGAARFTSFRFHPANLPDHLMVVLFPANPKTASFMARVRDKVSAATPAVTPRQRTSGR